MTIPASHRPDRANSAAPITGDSSAILVPSAGRIMDPLIKVLIKIGILKEDLDYHLIRAAMVIIFLFFGYQKWWAYEAERLIPYISNGPLIFWLYPAFGVRGASWFLGSCEWTFGTLLFLGFWNKRLGVLGALGSCATFIGTVTIIPFMPDGWDASAGGFPAMTAFSYERCRVACRIILFAEAGYNESDAFRQRKARSQCMGTVPLIRPGDPSIAGVCRVPEYETLQLADGRLSAGFARHRAHHRGNVAMPWGVSSLRSASHTEEAHV